MFRILIPICFIILLSCKPDLNNPNDPARSDFWIRNFLQSLLFNDGCRNFSTWERRYGSGMYETYGTDFLFLSDGDVIVIGATQDPIIPGISEGVTGSFQGTPGVSFNLFLMRLSRNNGDIVWVDYLGQLLSNFNFNPRLSKFANGDLAISFISIGDGQNVPGLLSAREANLNSIYVGRHKTDGSRTWYTYLDSVDVGNFLASAVDGLDQIHLFLVNEGSNGHTAFTELPTPQNSPQGSESDTDILYAILEGNGQGKLQKYISSDYYDFPNNASYANGSVYLGGVSAGSMNGYTHPGIGQTLPYILKVNTEGNIDFLVYNGNPSTTYSDSRQLFVNETSILQLITTNSSWSSVVKEPMQNDTEHYAFAQYDVNGSLQWVSFLGSSIGDVASFDEPPTIFDSRSGLWRNRSRIPNVFDRYSSGSLVSNGDGSGTYQIADVFIQPATGLFESIRYTSNIPSPESKRTDQIKELCTGKIGYMDRIFTSTETTPTKLGFQTSME
ncbi:putative lipoprotein [Leptospira yanagawae serovar Saopaulo str. Sao Paulo = ATCC 700523]|uniref:Putative lipoprotein n=1 Tax=Leptospira yanagawae serovar Saopaulo str. Sao Paulo = ATCC 700523 TaxID=1249483 RepID=A0A5E8HGR3_9LEPT|nr:hypothetical protein [Leptospira yanagawae]EOQ90092.1 putative lipoprotein [Leptospira yanagawae serovar Saopaulo str. Sao Paulo = ATCC 700523]